VYNILTINGLLIRLKDHVVMGKGTEGNRDKTKGTEVLIYTLPLN